MRFFSIAGRAVGPGEPTLVIAEIGVNHDGSLRRAEQLVHFAADAGADVVKFQIFRTQNLVHPLAHLAKYQEGRCGHSDPAEMLRTYELPPLEIARLVELTRRLDMLSLATPFSVDDVDVIEHLDFPAVKIASPDLVNLLLLQRCARLGRPMLVSTGAATMREVEQCVAMLTQWGAQFALMHCVSAYPVPADQANIGWISELAERFDVPIGFSDHTSELHSGACAVSAGACVVEKHLTYDRGASGPDHAASADPQEFADYVDLLRRAERLRGRRGKCVLPIERDVRTVSRQSLVLRRDVDEGHILEEADLIAQRPGTGICAIDTPRAVGRRIRRTIPAGTLLQWDMLSDAA